MLSDHYLHPRPRRPPPKIRRGRQWRSNNQSLFLLNPSNWFTIFHLWIEPWMLQINISDRNTLGSLYRWSAMQLSVRRKKTILFGCANSVAHIFSVFRVSKEATKMEYPCSFPRNLTKFYFSIRIWSSSSADQTEVARIAVIRAGCSTTHSIYLIYCSTTVCKIVKFFMIDF